MDQKIVQLLKRIKFRILIFFKNRLITFKLLTNLSICKYNKALKPFLSENKFYRQKYRSNDNIKFQEEETEQWYYFAPRFGSPVLRSPFFLLCPYRSTRLLITLYIYHLIPPINPFMLLPRPLPLTPTTVSAGEGVTFLKILKF